MTSRIQRVSAALLFSTAVFGATAAHAAGYPERPVTLVVGYSPGGGSDILTRIVGKALSEKWGQPVVVENRAGADGSIGANYVAHATPNGYTLIMVTNSHTMPPMGYTLSYDPITSFTPVSLVDDKPMVLLVHPALPVKSVKDLVALAKARPGQLNYGTDGPATVPEFIMTLFMQRSGIKMTNIPYKGGAQSQAALLSGEIQVVFGTTSAAQGLIQAGKLKALAVTTDTRSDALPDVPTIADAARLPGFNEGAWNGILAPAGTPKDIVTKIYTDVVAITKTPEMRRILAAQAIRPIASSPEEFTKHLAEETTKHKAFFKTLDTK